MEESLEIIDILVKNMNLEMPEAVGESPLVLAYIGDAVYELAIRSYIISSSTAQVHKLHKMSSELVQAHTQAEIIKAVELTEEELAIFKRGRNAKSVTKAKNATMSDYRNATGFEALIGYLYMSGKSKRMFEIINKGIEMFGAKVSED